MEELPDATLLPVAQSSPATHSRATAHLLRQHLPRNPAAQTNTMPVRHALSAKRGLPPLGFALATGINGSTSFHNASGKSSTVIGQLLAVEMFPAVPRVAG